MKNHLKFYKEYIYSQINGHKLKFKLKIKKNTRCSKKEKEMKVNRGQIPSFCGKKDNDKQIKV